MPPSVEIKMSFRHYDMLEKYVDKNQGNGCPPMGGTPVFLELEQMMIRIASQYHRSPNFFNFKINNMATAKNFDKLSEIVLVNKVILATSANILNMFLRAISYKFWAGILKKSLY